MSDERAIAKAVRNRVMIASVMAGEQDQLGAGWAEEVGIRAMLVYAKEATPTDTGALSSTAVGDSDAGDGCRQNAEAMREADLDWRAIGKLAGEHGVRFRTNRALVQFLNAIRNLPDDGGAK